jgi:hypothetical protein
MNAKAVLTIIKEEADKLKHLTDAQEVLTYLADLETQEAASKQRAEKAVQDATKIEADAKGRLESAHRKLEAANNEAATITDKARRDGERHLASITEQGLKLRAASQAEFDQLVKDLAAKRATKQQLDAELSTLKAAVEEAKKALTTVKQVVKDRDMILGRNQATA